MKLKYFIISKVSNVPDWFDMSFMTVLVAGVVFATDTIELSLMESMAGNSKCTHHQDDVMGVTNKR